MRRLAAALVFAVVISASGISGASQRWFSPLLKLPKSDLPAVACVLEHESRSTFAHPNLGDDNGNPGDSGLFQIDNTPKGVWARWVLPKLHVLVWKASAFQQAEGFVLIFQHDGWGPWSADWMCFG